MAAQSGLLVSNQSVIQYILSPTESRLDIRRLGCRDGDDVLVKNAITSALECYDAPTTSQIHHLSLSLIRDLRDTDPLPDWLQTDAAQREVDRQSLFADATRDAYERIRAGAPSTLAIAFDHLCVLSEGELRDILALCAPSTAITFVGNAEYPDGLQRAFVADAYPNIFRLADPDSLAMRSIADTEWAAQLFSGNRAGERCPTNVLVNAVEARSLHVIDALRGQPYITDFAWGHALIAACDHRHWDIARALLPLASRSTIAGLARVPWWLRLPCTAYRTPTFDASQAKQEATAAVDAVIRFAGEHAPSEQERDEMIDYHHHNLTMEWKGLFVDGDAGVCEEWAGLWVAGVATAVALTVLMAVDWQWGYGLPSQLVAATRTVLSSDTRGYTE